MDNKIPSAKYLPYCLSSEQYGKLSVEERERYYMTEYRCNNCSHDSTLFVSKGKKRPTVYKCNFCECSDTAIPL